jgi:hypothetical protein
VRATFRVDAPSSCDCRPPPPPPPPLEPGRASMTQSGSPRADGASSGPVRSGPVRKCRRTAVSTDEGLSFGAMWDQAELPDPGCKVAPWAAPSLHAGIGRRWLSFSLLSDSRSSLAAIWCQDDSAGRGCC